MSLSPLLYLMASFFPWNYGAVDLLVQHFPKDFVFKHLWNVSFILSPFGGSSGGGGGEIHNIINTLNLRNKVEYIK